MNWSWQLVGTDPDAPVPLPGRHNRRRKIPRNRLARKIPRNRLARKNYPRARTGYSPQSYPLPHSAVLHRRYRESERKYRLCRICTSHFRRVADLCRDTLRLWWVRILFYSIKTWFRPWEARILQMML